MAKANDANKPLTKSQLFANISETTSLSKKDVAAVFDSLTAEIKKAVAKKGPGTFTLPGLCKILVKDKPASPKKKVRNPANGEMVWSGPKPASRQIKVRAMKALKDMA